MATGTSIFPPSRECFQRENRSSFDRLQAGATQRRAARDIAALATAHNELVHDIGTALDQRTASLLEEVDGGDKALRDVLREILGQNIRERVVGVVSIAIGITLAMVASILGSLA